MTRNQNSGTISMDEGMVARIVDTVIRKQRHAARGIDLGADMDAIELEELIEDHGGLPNTWEGRGVIWSICSAHVHPDAWRPLLTWCSEPSRPAELVQDRPRPASILMPSGS